MSGDTWLCRDVQSGELVAAKLMQRPLPPAVAETMIREIKLQARMGVGHANIVCTRCAWLLPARPLLPPPAAA